MITRLSVILFTSQQLLWVTSFIDKGVISGDDEAKDIIQNMSIYSVAVALIFFLIAGAVTDRYPSRYVIPFAFSIRFIGALYL